MNDAINFFKRLLETSDWPPRWHCGNWTEMHGWIYIISDLMIWSAYFAIPLIIIRFISRKKNVRFHKIYFLFAGFILACGSTHLLDAVMFWFPAYRLNGLVRLITGIISWVTVFYLVKSLPAAFSLKSPQDLENEIDHRKAAEKELHVKNDLLNEAQEIARLGHWEWDVVSGELTWSKSLYTLYGIEPYSQELSFNLFMEKIHPDDKAYVNAIIKEAFIKKQFTSYYHRILMPDGSVKTMHARGEVMLNGNGEIIKMIGTGQDVTEQKLIEQELLTKTRNLEDVNIELQKFAYIASHDLQEPLRKMITFASLLEKNYRNTIDERAQGYVDKIITSSKRMQGLIDDILYFSRFNRDEYGYEKVNLDEVIAQVLIDTEITILHTGAIIHVAPLPVIEASRSQLGQLMQNLLLNAIKFRKNNTPPVIEIKATVLNGHDMPVEFRPVHPLSLQIIGDPKFWENERFVLITLSDNGIGFEQEYAEKIFVIFQRLHGKSAYEGTGIGLAICKKIVENHHGIITATSQPGVGTTFNIVLPVSQTNFQKAT